MVVAIRIEIAPGHEDDSEDSVFKKKQVFSQCSDVV
jgi:hypothetical protein